MEIPDPVSLLISVKDTSSLLSPISLAQRIKYTCIASSPHYIALGANTGGVYCFHHHDYSYIRILANKEGGVSLLKFSPHGTHLAVVSGGAHLSLWELNLSGQGISKCVHVSAVLKEGVVADMVWDGKGGRVFFGDDQGRIAVSYLPKTMFKKSDEIIHTEKAVVQMDMYQDLLLISTVTRCIILNVVSRELVQVGKRPRDGVFGTCYNVRVEGKPPALFSARPRSRLWEADVAGTVLSTLKLKEMINVPASPLLGLWLDSLATPSCSSSSLNFPHLSILQQRYLVCRVPGSALYLFLCTSYQLVLWTCALAVEDRVHCDGCDLWVLCEEGRGVAVLELVDVSTAIEKLVKLHLHNQARQVMDTYYDELTRLLPQDCTLMRLCGICLSEADITLTKHLLQLKETIATLTKGMPDLEGGLESVDVDDNAHVVGGGGDRLRCAFVNGEAGEEIVEAGEEVLEDHGDAETTEVKVCLFTELEPEHLRTDIVSPLAGVIQTSTDFPSGPVGGSQFSVEPDLDPTLCLEEELSLDVTVRTVDDWSHTSNAMGADENTAESAVVVMRSEEVPAEGVDMVWSQSKTILPAIASNISNHLQLNNLIPNSSGGIFSLGGNELPVSLDPLVSSVESQGELEYQVKESVASRCLQISLQMANSKEEDVIAVPVATRSSSTGSMSGKGKRKKKSRRRKTPDNQQSHLQLQQLAAHTCSSSSSSPSSLPKLSPTPSSPSLLHIPEEQDAELLPFPDVGLPLSDHSSPSISLTPSPYTSLPSTPPQVHTPPATLTSLDASPTHPLTMDTLHERITCPASTEYRPRGRERARSAERLRTSRSSSLDLPTIGGVAGALSKGQKVVRGFLSSLSSQHHHHIHNPPPSGSQDYGPGHVTSQPLMYRNSDALHPPTTYSLSSPSSAEEGEYAEDLSPLVHDQVQFSSEALPTPHKTTPTDLETTAFSNATLATRECLDSPDLLCSPPRLMVALRAWLHALEKYHAHILLINSEPSSVTCAPPLPPPVPSYVCYLATLCAEMAVYLAAESCNSHVSDPDDTPIHQACDNVTPISEPPDSSTNMTASGDLNSPESHGATISTYRSCDQTTPTSTSRDLNSPESHGTTISTCRSCDQTPPISTSCDSLDAFIDIYFDYLDLARLLQLLGKQNWDVRRSCWEVLTAKIAVNHASMDGAHSRSVSGLCERDLLSMLLQYLSSPERCLEIALAAFPRLLPWHVALACDIWSDQSDSSTAGRRDYVTYLCRLLGNAVSDVQLSMLSEVFVSDPKLLVMSLRVFLKEASADHTQHTWSGRPRRWSHMTEWAEPGCLEWLVDTCVSMEMEEDRRAAADTCTEGGHWLGLVRLEVAMGDKSSALKTILSLGDARLLTELQPWGSLLGGVKDWELVFDHLATLNDDEDTQPFSSEQTTSDSDISVQLSHSLTSGNMTSDPSSMAVGVSLKELVPCLVQTLGPEGMCKMLAAHPHALLSGGGRGQRELHSLLVAAAALHTQQRNVAHCLLEKVDQYLWCMHASAVSAHLRLTLQAEMEVGHTTNSSTSSPFSSPVPLCPRLEEVGTHWGIRTTDACDICTVCGLSLVSRVSERQPGLITFICGHVFHRNCVPQYACGTCFMKHSPNLLGLYANYMHSPSQQLSKLLHQLHT